MGQVRFFIFDADGFQEEHDPTADEITVFGLTLNAGGNGITMNTQKITGLAAGTASGDALSFAQASAQLDGLTMSGSNGIAMNSQKITGMADGTVATDAATYGQLQTLADGFDRKESCVVRTVADLSGYTEAGSGATKTLEAPTSASSENTHDGVLLAVDDRVLVMTAGDAAGSADTANGIYTVTTLGDDGSAKFKLTRASDANADAEVTAGLFTFVTEGTAWADTGWFITTNDDITVDTTAIAFSQFAGVGTFTGGDGIDITSGVIAVDLASNPGLEFDGGSPNKIRAKAGDGIQLSATGIDVDVSDFAGTGLEDDGSENLRLAAQGNGIAGGAGSTLSVDSDTETGGNIQGVNVTANGVGLDVNAIAGTGIEADGSANLRLAAQGNGIAGGAGSTLSVQPDSTTGGNVIPVDVGANGVGLDVDDLDGDGLEADGSGRLAIQLSASAGLELDGTSPNKTLQAKVDGTSIQINGSGELEVLTTPEAQRIENVYTTDGTGVTAGDAVYISGTSIVSEIDAASANTRKYIGLAKTTVGASAAVDVVSAGVLTVAGAGWTPGGFVYAANGGGLTQTLPATTGDHRLCVGKAKSATELAIAMQYLGKKTS